MEREVIMANDVIWAYLRCSSRTQNEARQVNEVKAKYPTLDDDHIIIEKASGKNFIDRKEYNKLRKELLTCQGTPLLVIASIDRLGRNMTETGKEWEYLTSHGIDIDVLDMPILNTRDNKAGLTGEFINKLLVQVLCYVGEKERLSIKERQRQGIDNALKNGTREGKKPYGRPKMEELPKDFTKYYNKGTYTATEIMKLCGITKSTYYRYVQKLKEATNER